MNAYTRFEKNGKIICSRIRYVYNENMNTISVQDIQRDLLTFLHRVELGESFLVMKDEQPLAEVRPVGTRTKELRPFGLCTGQFSVPSDFDQPLPDEVLKEFEGA